MNEATPKAAVFPLVIDDNQWRYMVSWAWRDALREAPTTHVHGANLKRGDLIVQAGTHTLFKLLKPVRSATYFGREYTLWEVISLNTPKQTQSIENFYATQTYAVLKGE